MGGKENETPSNLDKIGKIMGKTLNNLSIERNPRDRSGSRTKSEKNINSTSIKSNFSRKGIKIDMSKLDLNKITSDFLFKKAEKSFITSQKEIKSTARSKKRGDYESDSDLNSHRYNHTKSIGITEGSNITQFRMKMPIPENEYKSKNTEGPSEPKTSSRNYKDWSRTIPELNVNSDSGSDY